jgi:hypothetical protein
VKVAYIRARRPSDVAREVEVMLKDGCERFIIRSLAEGDMLDRERLGAARYAAGVQAEVELEGQSSPGGSTVPVVGAGAR